MHNDSTSQTLENFKKKFSPYVLPKTLVELIKFVDQYSDESFADGFYLNDDIEDDFFETWLDSDQVDDEKCKEYSESMLVFANADGTGGAYAMWVQEGNTDLEEAPIIFYSSEGEIEIVAQNLKELIKILSWGAEAIYFSHYLDNDDEDEDYDYYKEFLGYRPNFLKFREWMQETLNIKPVNIDDLVAGEEEYSEEVDTLVEEAQKKYKKEFDKWQYQFYKSDEELKQEYYVKREEQYQVTKKELLTKIAKKPTGDLYLKLAENERIVYNVNHEQIADYLEKGLEKEPNHIEILKMYAEWSKPKKAIELYMRLIDIHPNPETFYSNIASVYERDNKKLKAIEFYRKDIIENSDSYDSFSAYSQNYIVDICKELKSKDAISILEESLSHGINANTYLVLYKLYFKKKNYEKALENALMYIKHSKHDVHNFITIAERFFKKELYTEAEQLFRQILNKEKWNNRKMQIYNNIGLCNLRKEQADIDKAYEAFMEAFKVDAKEPAIYGNIYLCATLFYRNNENKKAIKAFKFCVKHGYIKSSYAFLGTLYNWEGKNKKALKSFEKALELEPENEFIIKNMDIVKKALAKESEQKEVTATLSEKTIALLNLLYELGEVRTKEFHLNIELFSGDTQYEEYKFLSDSAWFENDLSPYFKDRFIEFGKEGDGSSFCLWYYPGLVGEPPVVHMGTDPVFCTMAPSLEDFICLLTSCLEAPDGYSTKPKEIWEKRVVDMEYLEEYIPDIYEDMTAYRKVIGNKIKCSKYKDIMKRFKEHPKFHKWVKKVEKKDEKLSE